MVILAYLGIWIDRKHMMGKLLIPFLTLLVVTMATMEFNSTLPIVSYSKAIDTWTGISLTFVFTAFLVSLITNLGDSKEPSGENHPTESEEIEMQPLWRKLHPSGFMQSYSGKPMGAKIELIARIAYPVLFVFFVIIYSIAYSIDWTEEDSGELVRLA